MMKKHQLWYRLGLVGLALMTVSLSIFWAHPSDATSTRNQQMIELNLIDEVRSAKELGLDYLMQDSGQLRAEFIYESLDQMDEFIYESLPMTQEPAGILNNIRYAQAEIAQVTQDINVAFELDMIDPADIEQHTRRNPYQAVGYIDSSGDTQSFTPAILAGMFNIEANNGGFLVAMPEAEQTLVGDASGTFLQSQRVPNIDLIVYSKREDKLCLIPRVNANAVCRDAIKSVLSGKLERLS
ncbi:MAG: hypothetical protein F6K21_06935 [Symploca sp. SIO2D2]|nr:hypothetical protein [Symploca sp. SIO2D2]